MMILVFVSFGILQFFSANAGTGWEKVSLALFSVFLYLNCLCDFNLLFELCIWPTKRKHTANLIPATQSYHFYGLFSIQMDIPRNINNIWLQSIKIRHGPNKIVFMCQMQYERHEQKQLEIATDKKKANRISKANIYTFVVEKEHAKYCILPFGNICSPAREDNWKTITIFFSFLLLRLGVNIWRDILRNANRNGMFVCASVSSIDF